MVFKILLVFLFLVMFVLWGSKLSVLEEGIEIYLEIYNFWVMKYNER